MTPRILAVCLALIAGACGGGGGGGGEGGGSERAGGELDVWIMEPGAPELKDFFADATAEFETAHDSTDVNVVFKPWAGAHDQFTIAIGGGRVPDVAEMGSTWTPEFAAVGALAEAGPLDGFVDSLVEGATFGESGYGVPWYAGARALIYRSDVLADLGLPAPATWDELVTVGRAVRDRTGMSAFGVAGDANHYFLPMVWQNGGEIATRGADGGWVSGMSSDEAVEAIQFYADLYRKERFAPEGALTWNARDVRAAFEAGQLAMMIGGGWDVDAILAAHPELEGKVATALLPAGPSGSRATFAGGSHFVVFEDSDQQALASEYVEFLLEPSRVRAFSDRIGFLPGQIQALDSVPAGGPDTFVTQLKEHSRTYPPTTKWGGFEGDGLFVNAVQSVMKGDQTAAAAMTAVAEAMDQAFGEE
ncbi:MAG: extracellular solute-binding protein [Acidimicrobiia bacterium]